MSINLPRHNSINNILSNAFAEFYKRLKDKTPKIIGTHISCRYQTEHQSSKTIKI